MDTDTILALLPYQAPFLFVDGLNEVTAEKIVGHYTFKNDAYFYNGHFKNNPITPGVLLTECMAQIGLVCLGIYLHKELISTAKIPQIALTSSQTDFFIPVYPGEKVTVISEKELFRFNKLKCKVRMFNTKEEMVCRGSISGMITT